jgi:hypothetical protein
VIEFGSLCCGPGANMNNRGPIITLLAVATLAAVFTTIGVAR